MRTRTGRALVLAAAAALLGVTPLVAGTASASGPQPSGTLYRGKDTGLPASVERGHSVTLTLWYMQRSPDYLYPGTFELDLYNPAGVNKYGSSAPGVSVTWLDPVTGRWEASDYRYNNASVQGFEVPGTKLRYGSGYWAHVQVRVAFNGTVPLGTWHLASYAPDSYSVWTAAGRGAEPLREGGAFPMNTITVRR
ncbi:hypothetical protein [Streptacidiphilus sp. P02-A3a]|uniref:hypothetical protein n=1 Tax=Streptacidiphilus sp. P02-A3a TaxID=2704468 RepID=UPI0015F78D76|nr:hypothetical protein [Streptacidiphilus sp. P02-A3a]QMU70102.1 hypothetical protein GXP74_19575 [Streptacidiphilus sp. P02-A3a]QMU70445.1 hypothetical protein GXP74_21785 [Streptacidiphilus sp. P02-A3a]